jgi:filamentous hemagglutinin
MQRLQRKYLIETNVAFIDQNRFLGSDYFLTRIGYVPPASQKLLGDAFYTTQLVRQQIFEKTAQRYITQGISTDLAQMQALMDNAVTEKSALSLSVGIELSATQIASLSSDIIWLVDQVIDGQHALVPVVYLAQATLDGLSGNPANIAAGNDLTLTASNNITNSGAITAGRNLSLTAGNDITNVGGLIKAGSNVTLVSTNGDIINQAIKHTGGTGSSQIHEYIAAQGNITAGGNASLTAANDITNTASNITSTGNTTLTAGNDITIETEATRNRTESSGKRYHKVDDVTTNTASNITSGGTFTANAGDDIAVLGSIVTAAGDASLNAGKDVNIVAVANEETHVLEISKKGFMSSSSYTKQAYDKEHQEAEVHSGGNLSITTGQNVNLVGAKVDAANNINLNAGADVNIASVTDIHELHEKTTKTGVSPVSVVIAAVAVAGAAFTGGASLTLLAAAATADAAKGTKSSSSHDSVQSTQVGSDVLAGADLTSVFTRDTTLIASALHAGGGINITSGGETSILSAKNSDYVADAATGKGLLWQSQEGAGHNDETVVHTTMDAGNGVNINAAGGVKVDVKNLGTVQESVAELSKQPGLEYLATLQNNPNANFTLVDEAHKAWDYKAQGLTPEGAAILSIVVAMATAGAGSSLAGLGTAGTTTASAGAGAAVGSGTGAAVGASAGAATAAGAGSVAAGGLTVAGASAAAANAAFSSLVSTAAVSLANNQGDIGKTLKDLGSSDTVKSVVFAAVTAGVTGGVDPSAGIGTQAVQVAENAAVRSVAQSAIYGENLGDALVDNLKNGAVYAIGANAAGAIGAAYKDGDINKGTQLIAHAAIGCGIGASTSGNCGAGAAGGVVGELAAEKYLAEKLKDGIKISDIPQIEANGTNFGQLAGALTAAIAGADANGIYTAAGTATNSARNNTLDTLVDALQVLYDAGKIGYGKYTNDKGMVEEGYYDLAADVAATAIPFVPAGSTKVARMLGKGEKAAQKSKILDNIAESKAARESSNFKIYGAKEDQVISGYNADNWNMVTLPEGSKVYGGTPGPSKYYTNSETINNSGLIKEDLFQSLQVKPSEQYGYRPSVTEYKTTKDIQVPSGAATSNPQYGNGGGGQFYINDPKLLEPVTTIKLNGK